MSTCLRVFLADIPAYFPTGGGAFFTVKVTVIDKIY